MTGMDGRPAHIGVGVIAAMRQRRLLPQDQWNIRTRHQSWAMPAVKGSRLHVLLLLELCWQRWPECPLRELCGRRVDLNSNSESAR
jgi:hypothetical protein